MKSYWLIKIQEVALCIISIFVHYFPLHKWYFSIENCTKKDLRSVKTVHFIIPSLSRKHSKINGFKLIFLLISRHYLKSVESFLVGKRTHRKQFLKQLESDIDEFLYTFPNASVKDLQTEFGTPAEILYEYASTLDDKEIIKCTSIKRLLAYIITFTVLAVLIFCIFNAVWWNKTTQVLHQKDAWNKRIVSILDKSYD